MWQEGLGPARPPFRAPQDANHQHQGEPSPHPQNFLKRGLTPTNGASSGGTGKGLAPGMGSEMTRLDLEADSPLGRTEPLLLPICCISCTARSGILLGSAQACCHSGSFCASSSLP